MVPAKLLYPAVREWIQLNTPDTIEQHYTTIVKEHFKAIYFEIIDAVYNAPRERFEQPAIN